MPRCSTIHADSHGMMSRVPVVPGGRGRCNMTQGAVAVERGAAALALPLNLEGAVDTGASVRPSVRDVAAHAGVSVGTVSHVLNHPERVSETTRKRVEGPSRLWGSCVRRPHAVCAIGDRALWELSSTTCPTLFSPRLPVE